MPARVAWWSFAGPACRASTGQGRQGYRAAQYWRRLRAYLNRVQDGFPLSRVAGLGRRLGRRSPVQARTGPRRLVQTEASIRWAAPGSSIGRSSGGALRPCAVSVCASNTRRARRRCSRRRWPRMAHPGARALPGTIGGACRPPAESAGGCRPRAARDVGRASLRGCHRCHRRAGGQLGLLGSHDIHALALHRVQRRQLPLARHSVDDRGGHGVHLVGGIRAPNAEAHGGVRE